MTFSYKPKPETEVKMQKAIKHHDIATFRHEIKRGFPVSHMFYERKPEVKVYCLLQLCVRSKFTDGVYTLLCEENVLQRSSYTEACELKHVDILKIFWQKACDEGKNCSEYIHLLLYHNLPHLAQSFIEMDGFNLNDQSGMLSISTLRYAGGRSEQTPLHIAVAYQNTSLIAHLINRGAILDLKDSCGFTPLHLACRMSAHESCLMLLKHGSNANWIDSTKKYTDGLVRSPLHAVCYLSAKNPLNDHIVSSLYEAGLDVRKEAWIAKDTQILTIDHSTNRSLIMHRFEPAPLELMCLQKIRAHLLDKTNGKSIYDQMGRLPVPPVLQAICNMTYIRSRLFRIHRPAVGCPLCVDLPGTEKDTKPVIYVE